MADPFQGWNKLYVKRGETIPSGWKNRMAKDTDTPVSRYLATENWARGKVGEDEALRQKEIRKPKRSKPYRKAGYGRTSSNRRRR